MATKAERAALSNMASLYSERVLPMEERINFSKYGHFDALGAKEMKAGPQVLLLGQYSTGKTSMIRYLVGRDFPRMHIGPEPTTDKFIAVRHGNTQATISGNAAVVEPELPYVTAPLLRPRYYCACPTRPSAASDPPATATLHSLTSP